MELTIIKTFRDGTVLVKAEDGKTAIMCMEDYEKLLINGFDLRKAILSRLDTKIKHCKFDIREENSRDFVYMDDAAITNLSIESLQFWINENKMSYDEANKYVDRDVIPSIMVHANKEEYDRCKEDPMYFYKHYCRVRNKE